MIPHERSLVKKLEGRPFALIGVNTDPDREMVKTRSKEDQVTWRSFYDKTGGGPICRAWSVRSFPSIFLIDHKGVIRYTNLDDSAEIEKAVEQLLAEREKELQ
jgi:hypothetical protein